MTINDSATVQTLNEARAPPTSSAVGAISGPKNAMNGSADIPAPAAGSEAGADANGSRVSRTPARSTIEVRSRSARKPAEAPAPVPPSVSVPAAKMPPTLPPPRTPFSLGPATLLALVLAAVLGYSIFDSFTTRQRDTKGCSMCYMRPTFHKYADFDTEHSRFASKYSLYLYREGSVDTDARVKGVPVLFIPGNAGSYKQVRPLAAAAATAWHGSLQHDEAAKAAGKRPLDFFTVDFNEDMGAFHGQTLLDQAEYLNEAVAYILALYHDPARSARERDGGLPDPTSVVLVGHSMGGIVARTMLALPGYQAGSINTIVTLAAPHARPPVSFDADIVRTYARVNDYWRRAYSQQWASDNPLWHVTLVSISGGGLDTVVPSDYSTIASLVPPTHGFTVFTSTIPEVWTAMDHLAITWCNQLRHVVVGALYDVTDAGRPSQTRSRAERMTAFKRRFLTGMEDVAERALGQQKLSTLLTLEDRADAYVAPGRRLVVRGLGPGSGSGSGRPRRPMPYLVPIPAQSPEATAFVLMTDQPLADAGAADADAALEVLFCSVLPSPAAAALAAFAVLLDLSDAEGSAGTTRLACKSAAADAILLPASNPDSRHPFDNYLDKDWNLLAGRAPPLTFLQYDLEALADYDFVAVVDHAPHPRPGWVLAEFYKKADAVVETHKTLGDMLGRGLDVSLARGALTTEIRIPSVQSSLLAYTISIAPPPSCPDGRPPLFQPLLRQHIADPYESKWFVNAAAAPVDMSMHGVAPYMPPPLRAHAEARGLSLQLWLDPSCPGRVDVSVRPDWRGSLGKLWMRYRTVFAAFPLLVVALVLRKQFQVYDATRVFISFTEATDLCLRGPVPALLAALAVFGVSGPALPVFRRVLGFGGPATKTGADAGPDYTSNDLLLGSHDPVFALLVPLFGLVCAGVCIALNYAALALTHALAAAVAAVRALVARDRLPAPPAVTPFKRRVVITGVLLLLVSTVIPYQFVFIVLCVVQLATTVRALGLARETYSPDHLYFYNLSHSVLLLMLWLLPINLPTLVVWVHNISVHWLTPFSSHHNILSIMSYVLLVETLSSMRMVPNLAGSPARHLTGGLLLALAVFAAVYGVTYAYLLHQLVNLVCLWLACIYLLDPSPAGVGLVLPWLVGRGKVSGLTAARGAASNGSAGAGAGTVTAVGTARSLDDHGAGHANGKRPARKKQP